MSTPVIIRWDQSYNRNGEKLQRAVVNAIRTYMDNHSLTGWVSAGTLARDTGLSERTVREQIAANVAAGWLEVRESGEAGRANTYRLTFPIDREEYRTVVVPPCEIPQGHPAEYRTPTTPRTSPPEKFSSSSPRREDRAEYRTVPDGEEHTDPFGGSGVGMISAIEERTSPADPAEYRTVPAGGAPERTVGHPRRPDGDASGDPFNATGGAELSDYYDPFVTTATEDDRHFGDLAEQYFAAVERERREAERRKLIVPGDHINGCFGNDAFPDPLGSGCGECDRLSELHRKGESHQWMN